MLLSLSCYTNHVMNSFDERLTKICHHDWSYEHTEEEGDAGGKRKVDVAGFYGILSIRFNSRYVTLLFRHSLQMLMV